jgi:hypothetical protein
MNVRKLISVGVLACCSVGLVIADWAAGLPALAAGDVSGAAQGLCHDCRDMLCGYCAKPEPCHEVLGYCYETVRNVSKVCIERPNAPYERCKWRVDDQGSCVTQMLNPCTPENVICVVPIATCGPMGVCIPEGTCTH